MTNVSPHLLEVTMLTEDPDDELAPPLATHTLDELKASDKMIRRSPSWMWAYQLEEMFITGQLTYWQTLDVLIAAIEITSPALWLTQIGPGLSECDRSYGYTTVAIAFEPDIVE